MSAPLTEFDLVAAERAIDAVEALELDEIVAVVTRLRDQTEALVAEVRRLKGGAA